MNDPLDVFIGREVINVNWEHPSDGRLSPKGVIKGFERSVHGLFAMVRWDNRNFDSLMIAKWLAFVDDARPLTSTKRVDDYDTTQEAYMLFVRTRQEAGESEQDDDDNDDDYEENNQAFREQYEGKYDSEEAFWREHFLSFPLEQQVEELRKFTDWFSFLEEIRVEGNADWYEYIDWESVAEDKESHWFIETITGKVYAFKDK